MPVKSAGVSSDAGRSVEAVLILKVILAIGQITTVSIWYPKVIRWLLVATNSRAVVTVIRRTRLLPEASGLTSTRRITQRPGPPTAQSALEVTSADVIAAAAFNQDFSAAAGTVMSLIQTGSFSGLTAAYVLTADFPTGIVRVCARFPR